MGITKEQRAPAIVKRLRRYFPQVDRVADANKSVVVDVTEKDCRRGTKKAEDDCAMARAIMRQKGCDGAIIRPRVAYIIKGNMAIKYEVPTTVAREIVSFDRNKDFRPGAYQLSAVFACHKQEALAKKKHRRTGTGHKNKHRKPLISRPSEGMRGVRPKD